MTIFDDPNRECVGLQPIWTPEAPPEGETQQAPPAPAPVPQPAPAPQPDPED